MNYLSFLTFKNNALVTEYLVGSDQLGNISIFFIDYKNEEFVYQSSSILLNLLSTPDNEICDVLLEPEHNVINFITTIFKNYKIGRIVKNALYAMNNIACENKYSEIIMQTGYIDTLTKIVDLKTLEVNVVRLIAWGLA